jgi:hypothetical protein
MLHAAFLTASEYSSLQQRQNDYFQ